MSMPILSKRIQTTLEQLGTECPLEEVMNLCPEITWNQLFLAIDHLSRAGQIRIGWMLIGRTGFRRSRAHTTRLLTLRHLNTN